MSRTRLSSCICSFGLSPAANLSMGTSQENPKASSHPLARLIIEKTFPRRSLGSCIATVALDISVLQLRAQ